MQARYRPTGSGKPPTISGILPHPDGMGNPIGQVCSSNLLDLLTPVTSRLPLEIKYFSYFSTKINKKTLPRKGKCSCVESCFILAQIPLPLGANPFFRGGPAPRIAVLRFPVAQVPATKTDLRHQPRHRRHRPDHLHHRPGHLRHRPPLTYKKTRPIGRVSSSVWASQPTRRRELRVRRRERLRSRRPSWSGCGGCSSSLPSGRRGRPR